MYIIGNFIENGEAWVSVAAHSLLPNERRNMQFLMMMMLVLSFVEQQRTLMLYKRYILCAQWEPWFCSSNCALFLRILFQSFSFSDCFCHILSTWVLCCISAKTISEWRKCVRYARLNYDQNYYVFHENWKCSKMLLHRNEIIESHFPAAAPSMCSSL